MSFWHIDEGSHLPISVNIQIFILLKGWSHLQGVSRNMMQYLLELQRNHSPKINIAWNKICMNLISNDYVYQSTRTICCKHNIHSSPWWLEKWHWKNMCLLVQNIKHAIPNNGGKKYFELHHVWSCALPHEHKTK
jgi:hypothetical protein